MDQHSPFLEHPQDLKAAQEMKPGYLPIQHDSNKLSEKKCRPSKPPSFPEPVDASCLAVLENNAGRLRGKGKPICVWAWRELRREGHFDWLTTTTRHLVVEHTYLVETSNREF